MGSFTVKNNLKRKELQHSSDEPSLKKSKSNLKSAVKKNKKDIKTDSITKLHDDLEGMPVNSVSKKSEKSKSEKKSASNKTKTGKELKYGEKKSKSQLILSKPDKELSKKERKQLRKAKNPNFNSIHKAKLLWNELRKQNLSVEKRLTLSEELFNLVKGKAKILIFAHDTSRVIECLMKYGTQSHRDQLFNELQDQIINLAQSKYAKFFVRKLLKYGSKTQKNHVFQAFYGNVETLVRHREASELLECAYSDYANADQRKALIEEFYGPSFALFKTEDSNSLKHLMESNPQRKEAILSNMKKVLTTLANKHMLQYSITHKVYLEYFTYSNEKQRSEMIETLRESLVHMLHTKEGARVAMNCLWYGTAKDRKMIVKSFKTLVLKICMEEYGHMVLLAMFDVVDDTKLVSKAILEELVKSLHEVSQNQYGRKVLLYLLSPRNSLHFHPDIIKILEQGDSNPTSKKDGSLRKSELLKTISNPFLKFVCDNSQALLTNSSLSLLLISILQNITENSNEALTSIAKQLADPETKADNENNIEHPTAHFVIKKLLSNDRAKVENGEPAQFCTVLLNNISDDTFVSWLNSNRGCFTLVGMIETKDKAIAEKMTNLLKSEKKNLKRSKFKGAKILLNKLND